VVCAQASHALPDVDGDRVFLQGDREFQARTRAQGDRILGLASQLIEQVCVGALSCGPCPLFFTSIDWVQFKPSLANSFRTELQRDPEGCLPPVSYELRLVSRQHASVVVFPVTEPDGFEPCVEFIDELTEHMDIALDEVGYQR
jgi:hypothetical protein